MHGVCVCRVLTLPLRAYAISAVNQLVYIKECMLPAAVSSCQRSYPLVDRPLLTEMCDKQVTVLKDRIYVYGGYRAPGNYLDDLYEIDPSTGVSTRQRSSPETTPPGRRLMGFTGLGDRMYVFGGERYEFSNHVRDGRQGWLYLDDLNAFDLVTRSWQKLEGLNSIRPSARCCMGLSAYGSDLLVSFGSDVHGELSDVFGEERGRE
jgi:hypothetical protein